MVVRAARLEGRTLGLTFFAYETTVQMKVPARGSDERTYELDLIGIRGQATGLFPARLVLLDERRHEVAVRRLTVDVRGSLRSVYGAFGLAVAGLALLLFVRVLLGLARHTLPSNRFWRALRFAVPGAGFGLTAVFTLSALRLYVPSGVRWAPLVAGGSVLLFAVGFLTPTPDADEGDDEVTMDAGTEHGDEQPRADVPTVLTASPAPSTLESGAAPQRP